MVELVSLTIEYNRNLKSSILHNIFGLYLYLQKRLYEESISNMRLLFYLDFLPNFLSFDVCFSFTSRSNHQGNRYLTIYQSCMWSPIYLSRKDVWILFSYICSLIHIKNHLSALMTWRHTIVCLFLS